MPEPTSRTDRDIERLWGPEMKSRFRALSDEELVEAFSPIAQRLGDIVVNWLPGGAKETRLLFALEDEIRSRGREARLKLASLLHSDDRFVRYYAAQDSLACFRSSAGPSSKKILENLMRLP